MNLLKTRVLPPRWRQILCACTTLCVVLASNDALAVRDRPHIDQSLGYNVILSDRGTTLRGVSLSFDGGDPYGTLPAVMPSVASLTKLSTEYGYNTVHLYLEGDAGQNPDPVGVNLALADELVQRTRDTDLYLIITVGNNGENGAIHSMQKTLDFWSLYGERYKHETHVIFEAHNEPAPSTLSNWTQQDWDNQLIMYNHIRGIAPDTMILLGSFMSFFPGSAAIEGADMLKAQGVSWDNAGFAFHGYWNLPDIEKTIAPFLASTDYPALICTEFWPGDTENGYNAAFETYHIGWQQFQWLAANDMDLENLKNKLNVAGTVWKPELAGTSWPASGAPSIPLGAEIGIFSRAAGMFVSLDGTNLKANKASYSKASGENFTVVDVGNGHVALRADNGSYVSAGGDGLPMTVTASTIGNAEKWEWLELPSGDFALRPWGGGGHLWGTVDRGQHAGKITANGDDASLNGPATLAYLTEAGSAPAAPTPPPPPSAGPFYGTPTVIPTTSMLFAADFDHGGEGVAYHDIDDENWGGQYRFDVGVDIEATNEGTTNVGWIDPGEWLNYTVDVQAAGTYTFTFRVASAADNGSFHIEFDGVDVTGPITTPNSGAWNNWVNITREVELVSGVQVMTMQSAGGFNLIGFDIQQGSAPPPPPATDMYASSVVVGTAPASRGQKYGTATVTVLDNNASPVAGATVTGNFTSGIVEGGVSAVTDNNGVAVLQSSVSAGGNLVVEFCVADISGSLNYDESSSVNRCF
ncbi:carbohydrate-binding protein [Microbulbifer salipaludis]|uniref:Carbohydrate-binding protein n=1 Tax=Microbulbifer salipaludis TaxID=187980 RepID=A0ABS3E2Q0_9GAMM|nr:carbohydrate-binding protein [Microbulbifer salipaludis]MBN8429419.1 carbohydrate-binding protein [Microbulbifer salipaludis]